MSDHTPYDTDPAYILERYLERLQPAERARAREALEELEARAGVFDALSQLLITGHGEPTPQDVVSFFAFNLVFYEQKKKKTTSQAEKAYKAAIDAIEKRDRIVDLVVPLVQAANDAIAADDQVEEVKAAQRYDRAKDRLAEELSDVPEVDAKPIKGE